MIDYYLLTKPKIIIGNLITVAAGFLLASKGSFDITLFLATLAGIAFIMASSCVFNNYLNRKSDKNMERTKNRALVIGLIAEQHAIFFGLTLGILGNLILFIFTNILTVAVANIGFFVYVVLYSYWKYHSVYSTAIGSIAGAIPPVVGYCAVSNQFDLAALIFFAILVLWQMPHFFSIAIYHFKDYSIAKMPTLPIQKGIYRTKIHMVIYITAFIIASLMLTYFNYTGYAYGVVVAASGLLWLFVCIKGFNCENNQLWSRRMFLTSLLTINSICLMICLGGIFANI